MEPSRYGMKYTGDQPLRVDADDDSFERIQRNISQEKVTVKKNKASEENKTSFYHRLPPVKVVDDSFDRIQSHVSKEKVTVRKDKASVDHIKSFDHRLPPVKAVDDSFDRIQSHVFKENTLALYPTVAEKHHLTRLLKLRLAATHTAGLAYIAKNLAISTNLVAKPKPDNVLFDICLITQTKPTVILSIVKDPNADLTASRRYNLSLAKAVTDTIRRFTDEQFCSMYGLINESTLADQRSFDEALLKIKAEVSRICVPDSLSMSMQKYEKVGRAFLMSMGVTRFVTDETGEISTALWLLTFDQFLVLTENIDRNEVHVPAKYHSGIHVLMREVASRLEKGAPTLLLHSSNKNVELARRMSVCSYMCDLDEFQQDRNKQIHVLLNVDNIVTDCTQRDIAPLMTHNPNIWYFEDEETDSLQEEVTCNLMGG
ncbi:uncharacterized protein LOC124131268 [Haliotis rufescens]|uniref:uncharacterized protein LOC124131268 n=1 Tax=Haliotis rufescens TaxID=6454 RepID=UPI00201EF37B|nr:uncharacterized protein LOC124131268 [Haliotis rufescens]